MDYFELYIPSPDFMQSEIYMAELSDYPFESFLEEETALKAYITVSDLEECRDEVEEYLNSTGTDWYFTLIKSKNWNELWESNFHPVEVDGICRIRAPFHEPSDFHELEVQIMPKMSFGTGHHATTHLMVSEVLKLDLKGKSGLDMGSGTGVLSIVAVKRGAEHVDAIDIDEWPYENSIENIEMNGLEGKITPILGDVRAIEGKSYDFILANINLNVLAEDMKHYVKSLNSGSPLIVSGILEGDIEEIKKVAEALGLTFEHSALRNGWAVVAFVKN